MLPFMSSDGRVWWYGKVAKYRETRRLGRPTVYGFPRVQDWNLKFTCLYYGRYSNNDRGELESSGTTYIRLRHITTSVLSEVREDS